MNKISVIIAGLALCTPSVAQQQLAFPGAEGFGKYTTGGRGGKVYYVTRNDDCKDNNLVEGTFRWALRSGDDTPRTILFKTCGTIYLTSDLRFDHPNVTIDGSTAPGGGVCIAGNRFYVSKPNVIIRYMRFRAGDVPDKSNPAIDVENVDNVIIDHCSITWSMEECLTMYDCDSTTVQWSIIGEGLYNSKNSKGARAYATQWGGEHSTMHHCLITNCNNRTPRFNGVRNASSNPGDHDQFVDSEFFNNVIFNWGKSNSLYGGECNATINNGNSYNRVYMLNNYFRPGPATQKNASSTRYFVEASSDDGQGQWLINGNKFETGSKFAATNKNCWKDESLEKVNADNWYGVASNSSDRAVNMKLGNNEENLNKYALATQEVSSGITLQTADEAFKAVVEGAGASLPRYDEVDRRLLDEAAGKIDPEFAGYTDGKLDRGLGIINSPADIMLSEHDNLVVNGKEVDYYPYLGMREGEKLMLDSDGDGLPDKYELEKGLDPENAADGAMITESGYSNLELFLHGIIDGSLDKASYETETTGIATVGVDGSQVESRSYYAVSGERLNAPARGVNIVKEKYSDGTQAVRKTVSE